MELETVLILMQEIENDFPTAMEYETDARMVWPKRWNELRNEIKKHCKKGVNDDNSRHKD